MRVLRLRDGVNERMAVGAVAKVSLRPWVRWSVRIAAVGLLAAAVGSTVVAVASARTWAAQLGIPLAFAAVAVALVGDAVERRRRQQLEVAALRPWT